MDFHHQIGRYSQLIFLCSTWFWYFSSTNSILKIIQYSFRMNEMRKNNNKEDKSSNISDKLEILMIKCVGEILAKSWKQIPFFNWVNPNKSAPSFSFWSLRILDWFARVKCFRYSVPHTLPWCKCDPEDALYSNVNLVAHRKVIENSKQLKNSDARSFNNRNIVNVSEKFGQDIEVNISTSRYFCHNPV